MSNKLTILAPASLISLTTPVESMAVIKEIDLEKLIGKLTQRNKNRLKHSVLI